MTMIGMVMGDDHRIQLLGSGVQQLLPTIGSAIDKQASAIIFY